MSLDHINSVNINDPNNPNTGLHQDTILNHQLNCKVENMMRLKEVKNLEELISFKIKTVGDKMIEDGSNIVHPSSIKRGLTGLRAVIDPLMTSKMFPVTVTRKNKNEMSMEEKLKLDVKSRH